MSRNPRAILKCYAADGTLCRSFGATTKIRYRKLARIVYDSDLRPYRREITRARDGFVLLVLDAER